MEREGLPQYGKNDPIVNSTTAISAWAPPGRSLTCQIWLTETHFSGQNAQRTSLGFFTNEICKGVE